MNYKFSSRMGWSNGKNTDHQIDLDLDLLVSDILQSNRNLETRLITSEQTIREEVFKLVAEEIVPKIIKDTGVDATQPEGHVKVKANSKIYNQATVAIPTQQDTSLYIRDRMHVALHISTDRPLTAVQALAANKNGLAANITTEVMRLIKNAVLNVHEEETEHSSVMINNKAESITHKVKKSSSDRN